MSFRQLERPQVLGNFGLSPAEAIDLSLKLCLSFENVPSLLSLLDCGHKHGQVHQQLQLDERDGGARDNGLQNFLPYR